MAFDLIGNIGGLSGADFSPYQRELERRTQLVVEDMKRRQEEKDRALREKLGLKELDLKGQQEKRLAEGQKTDAELRREEEAGRNTRQSNEIGAQKDMQKESEQQTIRGEIRSRTREKSRNREDMKNRAKERKAVAGEEADLQAKRDRQSAALNRAASAAAGAGSIEDAMASLQASLDSDPNLDDNDKAAILSKAPAVIQSFQEHASKMKQVEQQVKAGNMNLEQAEQEMAKSRGLTILRSGDPETSPDVADAQKAERNLQEYSILIEQKTGELNQLLGEGARVVGTETGNVRQMENPNNARIMQLRTEIADLQREKSAAQIDLETRLIKLGRSASK